MRIYCEHGALTGDLRALQRDGRIELVHFPYDPGSRTRYIAPSATASDAQWRDLNTTWDELAGTWDDFAGSAHLPEIIRIIGPANRRDALHIDSAYKTGCVAFEEILNLQPKGGKAKPYQVKQVRGVIVKYRLAGGADEK